MRPAVDFLIIGAMKAATSTLYVQLSRQPGIFMPEPKEPNFFSDDPVYDRGLGWYESLFAGAPAGGLRGEASTHYTKLPTYPKAVERIRRHLPGVRLIYVMRDPIERLVSQYIHEWTQGVISGTLEAAFDTHPELVAYSRYAMQIEPYLDTFGAEAVLPVFSEALRTRPQEELERIATFLGYDRPVRWDGGLDDQNVSARRMRRSPLRDAIVEAPVLRTIRRRLVPQAVRNRIKALWTMRRRPELLPSRRAWLAEIFDEDLARLGGWLGVGLCCEGFGRIVETGGLDWADRPGSAASASDRVAVPVGSVAVAGQDPGPRRVGSRAHPEAESSEALS